MNQAGNQPIPSSAEPDSLDEPREEAPRTDAIGKLLDVFKSLVGSSLKAKLVFFLLTGSLVVFFLVLLVSIIRKQPKHEEPIIIPPTPTPPLVTPTPEPEETREEIDNIIIDIGEFDVNQPDLQPPVVDLKIGL